MNAERANRCAGVLATLFAAGMPVAALLGIWLNDVRWGGTALVFALVAIISGAVYAATVDLP